MSDYVPQSFQLNILYQEYDFDDTLLFELIGLKNDRWDHRRIDWGYHVSKKLHENMFNSTYRMSYRAFKKLYLLLYPSLVRKASMSRSSSPVPVVSLVAIGLRYLDGAKYQDLCDVHGVSKDQVYKCRDDFLDAVLECEEISIKMPSSDKEWEDVRCSFAGRSYQRLFKHCVGAIDGFFQPTIVPSKKDTGGNRELIILVTISLLV